jgi:hypothetical protein
LPLGSRHVPQEKFSAFTIIAAAITAQPLVAAARAVFALLQRNFLPTYRLWWVGAGMGQHRMTPYDTARV